MKTTVRKKGKIKVWIVILAIIGVIGIALLGGIMGTEPGRREIKNLTINDINFKNLRDGTYVGEYKGKKDSFRNTRVEVTVSSGRVTGIKVLKGALNKEGKPAEINSKGSTVEDLFEKVIETQSLQVDVISGATLTSKTHIKAVENALEQAD
ncbi:FMN-binding protein [Ruminiclostridium cellobioparum]|uniref:FMN-binding protein n=1 Tax=Ruminiclostridium cellobioparum TaxID=29355 RepID=UPI0028A83C00|nr:FMN-binding protein [Ruminiclostridium cellobioparum]